ncbi:MAG TPA: regulatory iron-sulfur-containing complex subunit RicT [Gemmataceae bacterium]|jgi:cell fate regulator YaaT (PSP1 superfamily)|nr:regulatory iron-sulfur-containing complex subunit RicT [Gemmataceae bacterium]
MAEAETIPVPETTAKYIVRHGSMRFLGEYDAPPGVGLNRGQQVIVRSERGQEAADILCPSTPQAVKQLAEPTKGQILRLLTTEDQKRVDWLRQNRRQEYDTAAKNIQALSLPMQLVDVEHLFGGERIVFYFLADKRVDFRELVKVLARDFQTRIELRQIGVRDEAKLLADYGDCGKPVCCNTHMAVMPPVSMRMAKLQKATLDPSKISGRCGRLKCCLRFEQDVYEEFQAQLPPVGSRVLTRKGQGKVLAQEILARKLLVEFEDGRRLPVLLEEVLTRL